MPSPFFIAACVACGCDRLAVLGEKLSSPCFECGGKLLPDLEQTWDAIVEAVLSAHAYEDLTLDGLVPAADVLGRRLVLD